MAREQHAERATERGIFDGFEGYMSPTDEDYRRLLTKGLVAPDANVLLNLYRYTAQTRTELLAVLEKIGNQLWVPNQVVLEFWRRRESAIREPRTLSDKTVATLEDLRRQSVDVLAQWANRVALPVEDITETHRVLEEAYRYVSNEVTKRAEAETAELISVDTNKDQILNSLQPILKGYIGPPMEATEYTEAVEEGMRRLDEGIPPGFKDSKKEAKLAVGDYLVWVQVLKEAERRCCDVLIVTDDVKEDWWRKEHGEIRGARLELVDELRHHVGTRLFMMRPRTLLLHAKKILRVKVSDTSVQDVERVERSRSFSEGREGRTAGRYLLEKLPEGRTGNYLDSILEMARLAEDMPDLETFLDNFQERFPTITLREEARRRMRVLEVYA